MLSSSLTRIRRTRRHYLATPVRSTSCKKFNECLLQMEELCHHHPQNERSMADLGRCRKRIAEARTGKYDFPSMITEASRKIKAREPPLVDAATYQGPIQIRKCKYGQGLFATRDIKVGELLLCEKAFHCAFAFDSTSLVDTIRQHTGTMSTLDQIKDAYNAHYAASPETDPTHGQLFVGTLHRIHRNPGNHFSTFTSLHPGNMDVALNFDPLVLNSTLCYRILEHNKFSERAADTIFTLHDGVLEHRNVSHRSPNLALQRLLSTPSKKQYYSNVHVEPFVPASMVGIWLLACRANHSCIPNFCRAFVGDMLILRASKSIPKDTEIFDSYITPSDSFPDRRTNLNGYGFECECPR